MIMIEKDCSGILSNNTDIVRNPDNEICSSVGSKLIDTSAIRNISKNIGNLSMLEREDDIQISSRIIRAHDQSGFLSNNTDIVRNLNNDLYSSVGSM
jgi:hypothetical protein